MNYNRNKEKIIKMFNITNSCTLLYVIARRSMRMTRDGIVICRNQFCPGFGQTKLSPFRYILKAIHHINSSKTFHQVYPPLKSHKFVILLLEEDSICSLTLYVKLAAHICICICM